MYLGDHVIRMHLFKKISSKDMYTILRDAIQPYDMYNILRHQCYTYKSILCQEGKFSKF